jgi:hypothetical protein
VVISMVVRILRRRLACVAGAWLMSQVVLFAVAPGVLCAMTPTGMSSVQCRCPEGAGQVCPMHHSEPKSTTKSCSCRSTSDGAAAIIASLFGPAAVLTWPTGAAEPPRTSRQTLCVESHLLEFHLVPDAPPPRA